MKCVYCHTEIENDATFCPNCGKKVPVGIRCSHCGMTLENGSEFCPYCGTRQTVHHINQNKVNESHKKGSHFPLKTLFIILLLAILGLLVYYLFFASDSKKANRDDSESGAEAAMEITHPADSDSVYQAATIEQQEKDSLLEITKLMSDSLTSLKDSLNNLANNKEATTRHSTPSQNGSSTQRPSNTVQYGIKDFGYGSYKGNLLGGKPHGVNGKMIFKRSNIIDSRDPQARVAEPGDYVIGEWVDGKLVQGIWFDADGQRKGSILIGR